MNRFVLCCALAAAIIAGCAPDRSDEVARLSAEVARLRAMAGPLPAAIDSLYPPLAKAPVFKLAMYDMATPFTACMIRMREGDGAAAMNQFERFAAAYEKASGLVPEWKEKFPGGPVEETRAAIREGNPEKAFAAGEKLGRVCHECHIVNMARVQQARLWPDFSRVRVGDSVSGRTLTLADIMMDLDMGFTGIGLELAEGRLERARASFAVFTSAMENLRKSCGACHSTERAYFVDKSVQASIDALGLSLRGPKPDPKLVGELSMRIGTENCGKCHLVHIPAAYAQARFREWNEPQPGGAAD